MEKLLSCTNPFFSAILEFILIPINYLKWIRAMKKERIHYNNFADNWYTYGD